MRLLKILMVFAAFGVFMFACRKEKSLEEGKIQQETHDQWEFKESSLQYQGAMDSAYIQSGASSSTLTLTGTDSSGNGQIVLQLTNDKIAAGDYNNTQVLFQFLDNDVVVYQNIPDQPNQFSISITSIDSVSVTGTFSGTVEDGLGNEKTITEGKFTAPLSAIAIPVEPAGPGQLTVWSKQLCSGGGNIAITAVNQSDATVAEQSGEITAASAEDPGCGATGTATFTLPVGLYTVTAICGPDTLRYDVSILENICTTLEVNFAQPPPEGDYLPLTQGSYWDYEDLSNSVNTNRIIVDGLQDDLDYRQYTRLLSSNGDSIFYRKEGSVYYQYKKLDFQDNITDAPSIDFVILHDDYATDQTWETPPIPITVQSIPINIKLQSTITRRDFQAVFSGTNYSNLIEVRTSLWVSLDGGVNFDDSGSYYTTIFAKGIGIVYYGDLKNSTEWGIIGYHIIP